MKQTQDTRKRGRGGIRAVWALVPIVLTAILSSYLYYQWRYDQGFRYYPYNWQTHWMKSPYHSGHVAFFRKRVDVTSTVKTAYLVVAADNFVDVMVNGHGVGQFFNVSSDMYREIPDPITGPATKYSVIGYPRSTAHGHVFSITGALQPGINVIGLMVQSDEGEPKVAVQGAIVQATTDPIVSDDTWKCSPVEQMVRGINWTAPAFFDGEWRKSVIAPGDVAMPIDGDAAILTQPFNGKFIAPDVAGLESSARLQTVYTLPDTVREGWLRVAAGVPYDLVVNGRLIGSTAMIDRYRHPLLVQGPNAINLLRARRPTTAGDYPGDSSQPPNASASVYLLKNVLHRGANTFELDLHPRAITEHSSLLAVYMDGRVTMRDGSIQAVGTDGTWSACSSDPGARVQPARVVSMPRFIMPGMDRVRIADKIDPGSASDWRVVRNSLLLLLGLMALAAAGAILLGRVHAESPSAPLTLRMGALFLPPAVVLTCAVVTITIFRPSPAQDEVLSSPAFAGWTLAAAAVAWAINLAVAAIRVRVRDGAHSATAPRQPLRQATLTWLHRYGYALAVAALMVTTALFCTRGLNKLGMIPDEYVSYVAARGVLRTGLPIYQGSWITYTRSSLYHYLLAPFVAWGMHTGDLSVTRLLSGFWHVMLVPLMYRFGTDLRGRRVGLAAAMLAAFSPFALYYARATRFYTQFSFFSTLCFYFLWKSVKEPEKDSWRIGVVLGYIAAYLSQELQLAMAPAIALVVFLSGHTRYWLSRRMLAWVALVGAVVAADLYAYFHWCATALLYLDPSAYPLIAFHLDDLPMLPSILLTSNERSQMAVGLLYVGGLLYIVARLLRNPRHHEIRDAPFTWEWWNFMYLVSGTSIFALTIITPHPNSRYTIGLLPAVALTAACVADELGRRIRRWAAHVTNPRAAAFAGALYFTGVTSVCAAAYRPLRVWNSTERSYVANYTLAARYIKAHLQPGDKVIAMHPEVAMAEIDQCDYFYSPYNRAETKYLGHDGRLRERDSGAVVIDNADKLRDVMQRNRRVWLLFTLKDLASGGSMAVAQMNSLMTNNFQVRYHELDAQVWLWDRSKNHYRDRVRDFGLDQIDF